MQLPNVHVEVALILGHLAMPPKLNRKPLGVIKRKILDRFCYILSKSSTISGTMELTLHGEIRIRDQPLLI